MGKIVSIHSFRGGTGKSNLTANLAALVARAGRRVGIVDTDLQSPGIHLLFAAGEMSFQHSLNDYLWGLCTIENAAHDVTSALRIGDPTPAGERPRLFLVPSSLKTGEIARVLREGYDVALLNDGFQALMRDLSLDYLFVDTHPGVNEATLLSIAVSDLLLLIMRPDNQDFQGTAITIELAHRLDVPEMLVLVNKLPPGVDPDPVRAQIQAAYQVGVVGILPLNYDMARLGSSGLFALRFPEHPLSKALRRIAETITT